MWFTYCAVIKSRVLVKKDLRCLGEREEMDWLEGLGAVTFSFVTFRAQL